MGNQIEKEVIRRILYELGFPKKRFGTGDFVEGTLMCVETPRALKAVTKEVYPKIARKSNTFWKNVEHNMRTVRDTVWEKGNRPKLNEIAGFELIIRPSVGELLKYIVDYIEREHLLG